MKIHPGAYFSYIFHQWMMFIMTGVSFAVLYALPQADEIFIDIGQDDAQWHVVRATELTVLFWASALWFSSRLIGRAWLADQKDRANISSQPFFKWMINNIPRVLGFAVISFYFASILKYAEAGQLENIYATALLLLFYTAMVYGRRKVFHSIPPGNSWMNSRWKQFSKLLQYISISAAILYIFLLIIFSIPATSVVWSQFIGPIAVLCLGLGYFTIFAATLQFIDISIKIPTTFILIIYFMIVGIWNNNDEIQEVPHQTHVELREDNIEDYFIHWYESRIKGLKSDTTLTVVLVAGQGGGSRAAYWTSTSLAHLDAIDSGFFKSLFALSTVSGSSAGGGFYCAYKRKELDLNTDLSIDNRKTSLRTIAGRDFLSPNTVPMFFQEFFQSLSPFGMQWTDRSKYLEDAWSASFYEETQEDYLDQHFMNIYDTLYQMPLQFYNSTVVERGMQALTAPFLPDTSGFRNQVYLVNSMEENIALKTAMSLSARFPFFTAPGKVAIDECTNLNLADGGYFENTGIGTLLMVYKTLQKVRKKKQFKFDVKLVYLQNIKGDYFKNDTELHAFKLFSIPVVALYNSWNTEAAQIYDFAELSLKKDTTHCDEFIIKKLEYHRIWGRNQEEDLEFPLSRYISKRAKLRMDSQVNLMRLDYKYKE